MPDLNLLRNLGDEVRPPSLDSLRETARRRNRRAAAFTVTACAAAVVAVIAGGTQLTGDGDQSAPKSHVETDTDRDHHPGASRSAQAAIAEAVRRLGGSRRGAIRCGCGTFRGTSTRAGCCSSSTWTSPRGGRSRSR